MARGSFSKHLRRRGWKQQIRDLSPGHQELLGKKAGQIQAEHLAEPKSHSWLPTKCFVLAKDIIDHGKQSQEIIHTYLYSIYTYL